jgi:ribA/ribD-fused uncharacterized protein
MAVEQFQGENRYLSNMYVLPHGLKLEPDGPVAPTAENPYQAAKFVHHEDRMRVLNQPDGIAAKKTAHQMERDGVEIRPDWSEAKLELMQRLVAMKFDQNPELAGRLVATGDEHLEEGNRWGDRYWGVSPVGSGKGMNYLGEILMDTRLALQLEAQNEAAHAHDMKKVG